MGVKCCKPTSNKGQLSVQHVQFSFIITHPPGYAYMCIYIYILIYIYVYIYTHIYMQPASTAHINP